MRLKTVSRDSIPNAPLKLLVILTSLARLCVCAEQSPDCHTCHEDPVVASRCKSGDVKASLLIATGGGLRQISLDGLNTTHHLLAGSRTSSVDYNAQTNTMFWYSYKDKKMYTGEISEGAGKSIVVHDPYSNINRIVHDWLHGNIYWIDNTKDELCVSNQDGSMKKTLFNDGISNPASIVVNPLNGWLHSADMNFNWIERAAMDGTKREVILSTYVRYPSTLTIDFTQNRIYWAQNDPLTISSSNFDGSNRETIFTANQQQSSQKRFKAMATFQESVYWIESNSRTAYRVNKCDGGDFVGLFKYDSTLYDLKVYDASRQPQGENHCEKRKQKCSHFCFPVPAPVPGLVSGSGSVRSTANSSVSTSCACPDRLNLSAADGRNCI